MLPAKESEQLLEPIESTVEADLVTTVRIDGKLLNVAEAEIYLQNSLKNRSSRRRFTEKESKLIAFLSECRGSKFVHDEFHITYDTISRLRKEKARQIIAESSVSTKSVPARYANILDVMKKHPGMGPMQIRDYIHRHDGKSMGVNTVRNIMIDAGWVPPVTRKRSLLAEEFRRYEAIRRNVLWHADFLHCYINTCKVYILFVQDDFSRFIVGYGIFDGEKADAVIGTFEQSMSSHGKPEAFISDKGSSFWAWKGISQFTQALEDHGIDQMTCNEPRTNGKVENLNQQFAKEVLSSEQYSSLGMFEKAVGDWVRFFNFERCHQGLDKLAVPADRFYPGFYDFKTREKPQKQLSLKALLEGLANQL
jgi:transposase InsO family protein